MTADLPVKFDEHGLIPAVVQDVASNAVVMVAYMNAEALRLTRETGRTHFWSRSRRTLWRKGETSGNEQLVREILVNCYADSLLVRVDQVGPGCHTDHATCYYRRLDDAGALPAVALAQPELDVWYGAYAFLRDHVSPDLSNTARLLLAERPRLEDRLADELVELAGVLRGTHVHTDPAADAVLEASQCLYWLALVALRHGLDAAWLLPLTVSPAEPPDLDRTVDLLIHAAEYWGEEGAELPAEDPAALAAGTAKTVADAVRAASVDLQSVLDADLASLRSKPYLTDYFSTP